MKRDGPDRDPERDDTEDVVDELENKHVRMPGADRRIDPASATHEGSDDPEDDQAGAGEPPD